jgi:hypothetical protein
MRKYYRVSAMRRYTEIPKKMWRRTEKTASFVQGIYRNLAIEFCTDPDSVP